MNLFELLLIVLVTIGVAFVAMMVIGALTAAVVYGPSILVLSAAGLL